MSSAPELDAALQAAYEPVRRAAREAAVQIEAMRVVLNADTRGVLMAQTYRDPIAHERMAAGTCPECGETADEHSGRVEFWLRSPSCDLLPRGVQERIDQYRTDTAGEVR